VSEVGNRFLKIGLKGNDTLSEDQTPHDYLEQIALSVPAPVRSRKPREGDCLLGRVIMWRIALVYHYKTLFQFDRKSYPFGSPEFVSR
jgi:hypothetical protein